MKDPKKAAHEYLNKQGYPLEMFVAKQFRKAGFDVYQSWIYTDKETGKHREVDIIADYSKWIGARLINFKVIIECKFAKGVWGLFTDQNQEMGDWPVSTFYGGNYAGYKLLERFSEQEEIAEKELFKLDSRHGYGLFETAENPKNDDRNTHKAISTILNTIYHERNVNENISFDIYIPIIVVQGCLVKCHLNDNDETVIEDIDEGQLIYKSTIYPKVFPMIEIVTREKVEILANKLRNDFERMINDHFSKYLDLIENYPIDWENFTLDPNKVL